MRRRPPWILAILLITTLLLSACGSESIQLTIISAPSNKMPFHVALYGGDPAKLEPGQSTRESIQVKDSLDEVVVELWISRSGISLDKITGVVKGDSVDVVITETSPNRFTASWK
ncbi:MAG: hypothetical protein ACOY94_19290 [Bacillota bacterium]